MALRDVEAFSAYSQVPNYISEDNECFMLIQCFVLLIYHSSSTADTVNDARRVLFTHKNRPIEDISPSCNVLCGQQFFSKTFHRRNLVIGDG